MKIPFTKMHGLGNNYIYLDLFKTEYEEDMFPVIARKASDVYTGIGSDGLILIHPSETGAVGMRIFNKDGSEGWNCGNGLRCVARYAYERGLVDNVKFQIEAKSGLVHAEVLIDDGVVSINMGEPRLERALIPMIGPAKDHVIAEPFSVADVELELTAVSMGNPHALFFVDNIKEALITELGPSIENDTRFPDRVNAGFVEVLSPTEMNYRVWERGSGITEACGTGACAAVVAAILNGHMQKETDIHVHLSGGDLLIKWDGQGNVWMTGEAEIIADGILYI
ncbi:diaminopimelate epimerase [Virgibacillus necropolis]|uniref:Diaminopimelate epimerase n=2 Tax=Virgibacillus necropolis TaxID=163877 RepID=A0A221MBA1_9BACI|nr:diaminopimelate epimerase [Virgibacillus necropolis]ASN04880.1 diaminopimelate epimerase [Virgibacillus necropolis]